MLTNVILGTIIYVIIGMLVCGVLQETKFFTEDPDSAIFVGMVWPIAIPMLMFVIVVSGVYRLIEKPISYFYRKVIVPIVRKCLRK